MIKNLTPFTIGRLAKAAGVSTDTLRYYEKMNLIRSERSASGYRLYDPNAVRIIRFILGAKALNFTLDEIKDLLTLEASDKANCAEVLKRTEPKILDAEAKIKELKEIQKILMNLTKDCPGDGTPTSRCPILDHIQQEGTARLKKRAHAMEDPL